MNAVSVKCILIGLSCWLLFSCSDSTEKVVEEEIELTPGLVGSGFFTFTDYAPLASKPVKVYFHIPEMVTATTPIVFLFHGDDRNASQYRNALINHSENQNFIVIAPEFSENFYPTGDQYNLGNVFVDGDNPSATTLNPESQWTFSIIEPIFDYVRQTMLNTTNTYSIIGHSAGGQFAHRFVMFKPNARFNTVISSASGWYTAPNVAVNFPYGFAESPLLNISLTNLYAKKLHIQIGSNDDDANAAGLRHNDQADAQGLNRLDRANYFFTFAKNHAIANATPFQWKLTTVQGLNHNYIPAVQNAADLLFK